MGLNKESRAKVGNFFKVKFGGITREIKSIENPPVAEKEKMEAEGWVHRKIQRPNTEPPEYSYKWLDIYPSLSGRIVGLKWYDTEEQHQQRYLGIKIKVRDMVTNEVFYLDLSTKSRSYDIFTKVMENIKYDQDVSFEAWESTDKETGIKSNAFVLRQNDIPIKWKYTKNNMGDCPPPVKKRLGGWDFSAQKEWLLEKFEEEIVPKVEELYPDEKFDEIESEYEAEEAIEVAKPDEITGEEIRNLRKKSQAKAAAATEAFPKETKPEDSEEPQEHWIDSLKDKKSAKK